MSFMEEKIKLKKLKENAVIPRYASGLAAGADLYACMGSDTVIPAGKTVKLSTGIAIAIPAGFAGFVYARSGLASKQGLAPANKVGVIDADYRGEIMVMMHNHSAEDVVVSDGERVAQIIIAPVVRAIFEEVSELNETERGIGGFGSTGRN